MSQQDEPSRAEESAAGDPGRGSHDGAEERPEGAPPGADARSSRMWDYALVVILVLVLAVLVLTGVLPIFGD